MVARNRSPQRRSAAHRAVNSDRIDAIALFYEKVRALRDRDQALQAVVRLRDAGQIRAAQRELARAERLHARIDAMDRTFAAHRSRGD